MAKYPEVYWKAHRAAADLVRSGGVPRTSVTAGQTLYRTVDVKQHDITPFGATRIFNHGSDHRWSGAKPINGGWEKGPGGLYLSKGLISQFKEAIFYSFRDQASSQANGRPLNEVIDHTASEKNIISTALPYGTKVIYAYMLARSKSVADLSPANNAFIRELCARLEKDDMIRNVLSKEGCTNFQALLFGDDYSASRGVATAIQEQSNVDGIAAPSARQYLDTDDGNLFLRGGTNEGSRVGDLLPKEKIVIIDNPLIDGADQVVSIELDPISGEPAKTKPTAN
jgi:hypothetical protein